MVTTTIITAAQGVEPQIAQSTSTPPATIQCEQRDDLRPGCEDAAEHEIASAADSRARRR